ncbi:hypothetical protein EON64_13340 [archaeon]|nr:MAG: hypothetical protein EON64_13340 [archaeon]
MFLVLSHHDRYVYVQVRLREEGERRLSLEDKIRLLEREMEDMRSRERHAREESEVLKLKIRFQLFII